MAANVTLPDELLTQARATARLEGKTVDELTAEAVKKLITQKALARIKREGEAASRGMSEEQIESEVLRKIRESRAEPSW
jgi:hypothetical protein